MKDIINYLQSKQLFDEITYQNCDNNYPKISNFFEKWYNKIKSILKIVGPDVESASLWVINFAGIKNKNSSSSFLKISFLGLLFIFGLF